MVCIYCQQNTRVTNSRHQKRANTVWRRRHCIACGAIFTTLEHADLASALMVRNGDQSAPFERDKLFVSIYDSLKHRQKPLEDASALTRTVMGNILQTSPEGFVERDSIVAHAQAVLHNFDTAAATMYGAFHPEH